MVRKAEVLQCLGCVRLVYESHMMSRRVGGERLRYGGRPMLFKNY